MAFTSALLASIDKLTVADVNAALRKYVDPSKLTQVYAGDFAGKKDAAKTATK
jgi:zinc protease